MNARDSIRRLALDGHHEEPPAVSAVSADLRRRHGDDVLHPRVSLASSAMPQTFPAATVMLMILSLGSFVIAVFAADLPVLHEFLPDPPPQAASLASTTSSAWARAISPRVLAWEIAAPDGAHRHRGRLALGIAAVQAG
ncbi:MAG: hypothetical protein ACLU3I_05335 [Acutalibacteraceae bacterium]